MKPFKGKVSEITTCNKEFKIVTNDKICEPYWNDGIVYHRSKGKRKNKQIMNYQYRQYRSWKYNRAIKWKSK